MRVCAQRLSLVVAVAVVACGGGCDSGDAEPADLADAATGDGVDAAPASDAAPGQPAVRLSMITEEHRAVPGAMFGGWGPHLGHLVRAPLAGSPGELASYWVDDLCQPATPGDCSVDVNRRVGVFRLDADGWGRLATIALPGVQQNTATIAGDERIWVYGLASAAQRVIECSYVIHGGATGCSAIDIPTGAYANYIGAALTPAGHRVVWWTNVVDGGGGSFSYIVDYGGGWNGPRALTVNGYNDCGYAHVGFAADGRPADFFCQVVSGLAPNWSFATLVGVAPASLATPVVWRNGLAPPAGDAVISTNDLLVAPGAAGGAHLLARSGAGAAVYYFKAADGVDYGPPATILPDTFRARWVVGAEQVALVSDAGPGTLVARLAPRGTLDAPGPLALDEWQQLEITLPPGFDMVYAIYPLAPSYQRAPPGPLELAVVGKGNEHAVWHIVIE